MYNINTPMWMLQHFVTSWSNTIQYNKHKIHVVGKLQHLISNSLKSSDCGGSCLFIKPFTLWMLFSECLMGETDYLHIKLFPKMLDKYMRTSDIYAFSNSHVLRVLFKYLTI